MGAYYNEHDSNAAAWLRELIRRGLIADGEVDERDIRDVRPADVHGFAQCHFFAGIGVWSYALRQAGWPDERTVWTGSCPCQPFSSAGKGNGFDDERHLWPAFHWLIAQCRPAVVFGEQVASKDAEPWLDLVQDDLEALDYAVGAVPFPSAGVGAPHIRDRLYWVADAASARHSEAREHDGGSPSLSARPAECSRDGGLADTIGQRRRLGQSGGEDAADAAIAGEVGRLALTDGGHTGAERQQRGGEQRQQPQDGGTGGLANDNRSGPRAGQRDGQAARHGHPATATSGDDRHGPAGPTNGLWRDADWLLCRDGRWRPVEPGTFPLVDGAPARVGRLRGYGNAICAPAAQAFIEAYLDINTIDIG